MVCVVTQFAAALRAYLPFRRVHESIYAFLIPLDAKII